MTDGPTEREIQRVREALEQHDSDLRDDAPASEEESDEAPEEGEEEG
jgi:hypothetical protein